MTQLRVKSPLLHDGQRFEVGDLIDESVLSDGQAEVLLDADILETVDESAAPVEASSETPAEPPAAVEESAPAEEVEEPAAEEAAETPAEEATEAEPAEAATPPEA